MVRLEKITDKNFKECINLDPGEGNDKFVAPNTISLAQAYLAIANDTCTPMPFAIYEGEEMIGFIQLAYIREDQDEDLDESIYEVWRFMIAHESQGKGYGKTALMQAIEYIKTFPCGKANKVYLSYVPGNSGASGLYSSLGFTETGEVDGTEIVMALDL